MPVHIVLIIHVAKHVHAQRALIIVIVQVIALALIILIALVHRVHGVAHVVCGGAACRQAGG